MDKRKMRGAAGIGASVAAMLTISACGGGAPPPRAVSRPMPPRTVPRTVVPALPTRPARGEALLRMAILNGHNAARAAVGVGPIAWDPGLARAAAGYAADMARSSRFAHAHQSDAYEPQGENLWMGTRGAYRYEEMVGHWRDERRVFLRAAIPYASRTGRFEDVGHYTQMIWRRTTHVGCAMAGNRQDEYLVCRYAPAGNVIGLDPFA